MHQVQRSLTVTGYRLPTDPKDFTCFFFYGDVRSVHHSANRYALQPVAPFLKRSDNEGQRARVAHLHVQTWRSSCGRSMSNYRLNIVNHSEWSIRLLREITTGAVAALKTRISKWLERLHPRFGSWATRGNGRVPRRRGPWRSPSGSDEDIWS